ncbi:MAG: hypothetical protein HY395_02190 [Candidatus Doudnabacteria bacterium]|nr:hypothetical protein [Candidatus Doudnabacteria bacterium]
MKNNKFKAEVKPLPVKKDIADKILTALLFAYIVPAMLTSPFGLYALAVGASRYYFRKSDFHREAKRLQKRGYVALTKTKTGFMLKLLSKGRKHLKSVEIEHLQLAIQKKWNGKWHLFIFDIPEENRSARDSIRRKLKQLGMYNIQRSVFVYPYDCRRELGLVSAHYQVDRFCLYAQVDDMDLDKQLRKHFQV